jgi:hypothetical protein
VTTPADEGVGKVSDGETVPELVVDAALAAVPGGTMIDAESEEKNGQIVYEIEISRDGDDFEVELDAEGNVLEIEEERGDDDDGDFSDGAGGDGSDNDDEKDDDDDGDAGEEDDD